MALPFLPFMDNRNRTFKQRALLGSLTQYEVRKHCAMQREEAMDLLEAVEPFIAHPTDRGHATPAETQFLTALSFFRSGSFQYLEGTVGGISQSTVSRIIERFSRNVVNQLLPKYLSFPRTTQEINYAKAQFFDIAEVPNTIGIVDGTHVNIKAPKTSEEYAFVNRKLQHSINCQVVANFNYSFSDIVIKWPGATHDAFIWRQSGLRERFATGQVEDCWILGDSGYPLEPWLLTPIDNPSNQPERNYNKSQKATRCLVERSIGIWKSRFRSMDHTGGTLCYSPDKCCQLIAASIFLHNYCSVNKIPLLPEDEEYRQTLLTNDEMTSPTGIYDFTCGIRTRQSLIQNYFAI